MWLRIGRVAFVLLTCWASLAQIAPEIFQLKREQMTGWLFPISPTMAWILLPLIVIGIFWYVDRKTDDALQALDTLRSEIGGVARRLDEFRQSLNFFIGPPKKKD